VYGLLLGGILGALDGLTALLYPGFAPMITGIVIGSTFKGVIVGLAAGIFAAKVHNARAVVLFGGAMGLLFAFLVAYMNYQAGLSVWVEIMAPGTIVGLIVGYAAHRHKPRAAGGPVTSSL
jgi:hypothetical protein